MGDKLLLRLNIDGKPIANKYCEGKMKRTLKRGLKDLKSLRRKRYERINCHRSKRSDVSLVWVLVRQRLSYTKWSLLWFRRQKARWVQRYRNQCRKRRGFTLSFYTKRFPGLRALFAILPRWFVLTRLETRTKESITYASLRVEKLIGALKGSARCEP